jgi:hypothetical protein
MLAALVTNWNPHVLHKPTYARHAFMQWMHHESRKTASDCPVKYGHSIPCLDVWRTALLYPEVIVSCRAFSLLYCHIA